MIRPVDIVDDDFWDLLEASREGDMAAVEGLVLKRPELVRREYNYTPPLHFAVREGHAAIVRFLLEHGAEPNYRTHKFLDSLLTMVEDREYAELASLFREIAKKQIPVMEGAAGFLDAARRGDLARIESDLVRNPDLVRARNEAGETALHQAAFGGHLGVMNA